MTSVGFEPTPLRTGALSQRLRPLGQNFIEHAKTGGGHKRLHKKNRALKTDISDIAFQKKKSVLDFPLEKTDITDITDISETMMGRLRENPKMSVTLVLSVLRARSFLCNLLKPHPPLGSIPHLDFFPPFHSCQNVGEVGNVGFLEGGKHQPTFSEKNCRKCRLYEGIPLIALRTLLKRLHSHLSVMWLFWRGGNTDRHLLAKNVGNVGLMRESLQLPKGASLNDCFQVPRPASHHSMVAKRSVIESYYQTKAP